MVQAYNVLKEMANLGFIEVTPVYTLLEKARELIVELNLYASDAVNLAATLMKQVNLVSEDKHLLRETVKSYVGKFGIKIISLKELYIA